MLSSMLCSVHKKVTHIRSYKTRLNSDSELIHFAALIILEVNKMSGKATNTNVNVSVLSRTDVQQIDSIVVNPRHIGR